MTLYRRETDEERTRTGSYFHVIYMIIEVHWICHGRLFSQNTVPFYYLLLFINIPNVFVI